MAAPEEYAEANDFLIQCPEFKTVPTPELNRYLEDAKAQIDPIAFVAATRRAHILATAHALAVSPLGRPLKLLNAKGSTGYADELARVRETVSIFRTAVL